MYIRDHYILPYINITRVVNDTHLITFHHRVCGRWSFASKDELNGRIRVLCNLCAFAHIYGACKISRTHIFVVVFCKTQSHTSKEFTSISRNYARAAIFALRERDLIFFVIYAVVRPARNHQVDSLESTNLLIYLIALKLREKLNIHATRISDRWTRFYLFQQREREREKKYTKCMNV